MAIKSKVDWVSFEGLDDGCKLFCARCGSTSTLRFPMNLAVFGKSLLAWERNHKLCRAKNRGGEAKP